MHSSPLFREPLRQSRRLRLEFLEKAITHAERQLQETAAKRYPVYTHYSSKTTDALLAEIQLARTENSRTQEQLRILYAERDHLRTITEQIDRWDVKRHQREEKKTRHAEAEKRRTRYRTASRTSADIATQTVS